MEVPSLEGMMAEPVLATQPAPLKRATKGQVRTFGLIRERFNEERRIALNPVAVGSLTAAGHRVLIETQAGLGANFADLRYAEHGAEIVDSSGAVFAGADVMVKVGPLQSNETALVRERQIIISALHLGTTTRDGLAHLLDVGATGIGFEFMADATGALPIVRMMHEIMGSMSVQVAARYLESSEGGKGIMLGGISGVPPSNVVILGAGVVGEWAARTALGYGANVIVLDTDLGALRVLEHYLARRVTTAMATDEYLARAIPRADVVIGALATAGERAPVMVSEDMVRRMQPNSIIVDAVVDQGGCIATSRPTTHSDPVYRVHDVIHYGVPNIPSNAARTASNALSNVLFPYLQYIGESSTLQEALWGNVVLRNGTYAYRRHLTKKNLAHGFGLPHRDIELLIASSLS